MRDRLLFDQREENFEGVRLAPLPVDEGELPRHDTCLRGKPLDTLPFITIFLMNRAYELDSGLADASIAEEGGKSRMIIARSRHALRVVNSEDETTLLIDRPTALPKFPELIAA